MANFYADAGAATLRLVLTQASQNYDTNTSVVNYALYLDCQNGQSYHLNDTVPYNIKFGSTTIRSGYFSFDFRSSTSKLIASGSRTITHNSDGYKTLDASGFKGADGTSAITDNVTVNGSLKLSRIPKPPSAPGTPSISNLAPTSLRATWKTPSTSNGASISGYQLQVATDSGFTQQVSADTYSASTLTASVTGLNPSTDHWLRVRAKNSQGWGTWSSATKAKTLSGFYVYDGSKWKPAEVLVRTASTWETAEIFGHDEGIWTAAS